MFNLQYKIGLILRRSWCVRFGLMSTIYMLLGGDMNKNPLRFNIRFLANFLRYRTYSDLVQVPNVTLVRLNWVPIRMNIKTAQGSTKRPRCHRAYWPRTDDGLSTAVRCAHKRCPSWRRCMKSANRVPVIYVHWQTQTWRARACVMETGNAIRRNARVCATGGRTSAGEDSVWPPSPWIVVVVSRYRRDAFDDRRTRLHVAYTRTRARTHSRTRVHAAHTRTLPTHAFTATTTGGRNDEEPHRRTYRLKTRNKIIRSRDSAKSGFPAVSLHAHVCSLPISHSLSIYLFFSIPDSRVCVPVSIRVYGYEEDRERVILAVIFIAARTATAAASAPEETVV